MPHVELSYLRPEWDSKKQEYIKRRIFRPVLVWTKEELFELKRKAEKND